MSTGGSSLRASESTPAFHFFLGGHDLEMLTIRELLQEFAQHYSDAGLRWGAKASAYSELICAARQQCRIPVLIELLPDLPANLLTGCRVIDHHNHQAGRHTPTSLEQVYFDVLKLPAAHWDRRKQLVAANDRAHIRGMKGLSLTPMPTNDELQQIRLADLAAQGISRADFDAAIALARQQFTTHANGCLTVLTTGLRPGLAAEALEPLHGGPGYENLLVCTTTEFAFYGAGSLVASLAASGPQDPQLSWWGGDLPQYGFWGAFRRDIQFCPIALLTAKLAATAV